jgi:enamine deaminase RidA (YjgF/YER057c/UK114 family)
VTIEERLAAMNLRLPGPPTPVGNYVPALQAGHLVFTSGQTARLDGVRRYVGVVGADVTPEEAYLSARDSTLNCLACVKLVVGDLERVTRTVKLVGFVNAVHGYDRLSEAIDGGSDLLEKLFGERGRHARSIIGVRSLPSNVSVEVELVVEVAPGSWRPE